MTTRPTYQREHMEFAAHAAVDLYARRLRAMATITIFDPHPDNKAMVAALGEMLEDEAIRFCRDLAKRFERLPYVEITTTETTP